MDAINKDSKIDWALWKQKKEEIKWELLKEKLETEDEIERWIWEEKWKTKDIEKSIKKNVQVYKEDIKN